MAAIEEELKKLLIRVKEESKKKKKKLAQNSTFKKPKIMASGHITLWQKKGEKWKQ